MKQSGQRQDIVYLGFALAALISALAIFLALRALSHRPAKAEAKEQKTAQEATPRGKSSKKKVAAKDPAPTSARDLFIDPLDEAPPKPRTRVSPRRTAQDASVRANNNDRYTSRDTSDLQPIEDFAPRLNIELVGFTTERGVSTAYLRDAAGRFTVRVGDNVEGYTVTKISSNGVELKKGKVTTTIRASSGSSSGRPARRTAPPPRRRR